MKRIAIIILSVIIFAALVACGGEADPAGAKILENGGKLVVIEAVSTGGSLEDALKALAEAGKLEYEGYDSDYGFFITSLNGVEADSSANEYFAVYTTLGEYEGVPYSNSEYGTYEYNGRTLASASYGVSGLIMVEGELYALVLESY